MSSHTIPRLLLPYANDRKVAYGTFTSFGQRPGRQLERKKVIVEFSSPNVAREFMSAHLRSTILGAFISNLYEAVGWSVVRINYLGDWGKNIGLLGVGWQKYASSKALDEQIDLIRYIHELYRKMEKELRPEQEERNKAREAGEDTSILERQGLFAERDTTFKRMEDGEPEALLLWKKLRDITIEYYISAYARLNVQFHEYSGESKVSRNLDAVTEVESALRDNGFYEEHKGAWVIDFDKHDAKLKLGAAALRDRSGSTTYLLRDIATVFDRLKTHAFDKMVYVVCEQEVHFRQVFKAVELMGRKDVSTKLQHIAFTRPPTHHSPGENIHLLGDILDQCETHMHEAMASNPDEYQIKDYDAVAKPMAINSLVLQELSARKGHNNGIDFNLLTLADGETGTNLQVCYARLCSKISKTASPPSPEELPHIDYHALSEPPWCDLIRLIARYPDATQAAFRSLEPRPIIAYLFRVCEELTYCLDEAEEDEAEGQASAAGSVHVARAVLYEVVRQVLENGMKLLGCVPVGQ